MKCIKLINSSKIVRCEDRYAELLVEKGMGVYSNKQKWKIDGRNFLEQKDKEILNKIERDMK